MTIMLDFQQKRKVRAVMYHKATLVILGLFVLVVLHSTWVVFQKKRESELMKDASLSRTEELRTRDTDLKSKIGRLSTDSGIEEEIRSKYSVVKENENMVVVVDSQNTVASSTAPKVGFWQTIVGFFTRK